MTLPNASMVKEKVYLLIISKIAIFSWRNSSCTNAVPASIHDILCDKQCELGEHLDINLTTLTVECFPCPPNTYNPGGILRFSNEELNWDEIFTQSQSTCSWINRIIFFLYK